MAGRAGAGAAAALLSGQRQYHQERAEAGRRREERLVWLGVGDLLEDVTASMLADVEGGVEVSRVTAAEAG